MNETTVETVAEVQQPKIYHVEIENAFGTGFLFTLGVVVVLVIATFAWKEMQ